MYTNFKFIVHSTSYKLAFKGTLRNFLFMPRHPEMYFFYSLLVNSFVHTSLTKAPLSTNRLTALTLPLLLAKYSGVRPFCIKIMHRVYYM